MINIIFFLSKHDLFFFILRKFNLDQCVYLLVKAKIMRIQVNGCKPKEGVSQANIPEYVTQSVLLSRFGINRMTMSRILGRFSSDGSFERKSGSGARATVLTDETKAMAIVALKEENWNVSYRE